MTIFKNLTCTHCERTVHDHSTAMIQSQDERWVVLELPKCIVVLPRAAFVAGLKRGKAWKRAAALRARVQTEAST